jgi:hypothetical protein
LTIRALAEADLERIKFIDQAAYSADEQYDDAMYRKMLRSGLSIVASSHRTIAE